MNGVCGGYAPACCRRLHERVPSSTLEVRRLYVSLQAVGHDIGVAWNKTSEAGPAYISVTLDDPLSPATVYARLIEGEDTTHDLIWSRSKPKAA